MIEIIAQDKTYITVKFPKTVFGNIFKIPPFVLRQKNIKVFHKEQIAESEAEKDEIEILDRKINKTKLQPISKLFQKYNYAG